MSLPSGPPLSQPTRARAAGISAEMSFPPKRLLTGWMDWSQKLIIAHCWKEETGKKKLEDKNISVFFYARFQLKIGGKDVFEKPSSLSM